MRPFLALIALLVVAIGVAGITSRYHQASRPAYEEPSDPIDKPPPSAQADNPDRMNMFDKAKEGAIRATLEIEGKGTMTLELYPKAAPKTVEHFVELAKQGFYEGILFHRVVDGFVAQAGDPNSKKYQPSDLKGMTSEEVGDKFQLGMAGSGTTVPLEANLPHLVNSIGLARSSAPDSGDSQFYINLGDNAQLDQGYCIFGRIVEGADIASKIKIGDRIKRLSVP